MLLETMRSVFGLGSVFALASGTYYLFAFLDRNASATARAEIAAWLNTVPSTGPTTLRHTEAEWLRVFTWSFDQVFGRKALSWQRIRRSWVISTVVVIGLTLLWAAIRREQFYALLTHADRDTLGIFKGVLFTAYILNLAPDYISALQTHLLITYFQSRKLLLSWTIPVLIADAAFKTVIFLIAYTVFVAIFATLYAFFKEIRDVWSATGFTTLESAWKEFFKFGPYLSAQNPGNPSLGIFYYSTFFPSVWLWLFMVSMYVFKALFALLRFLGLTRWLFDIERYPLRVIGIIASGLIRLGSLVVKAIGFGVGYLA
jgi:hypothetical protein